MTAATSSGPPTQASPSVANPGSGATSSAARPGVLTASFTFSGQQRALTPGGPAVDFTVTVTNGSQQTYRDVEPRLTFGECSLLPGENPPIGVPFPKTATLQERSPAASAWHDVDPVREGRGMDHLMAAFRQDRAAILNPGQVATFNFRVKLAAQTGQAHMRHCPAHINLLKPPPAGKKEVEAMDVAIGRWPTAELPLSVTFVN